MATRYGDFPQRIASVATGRGVERASADIANRISALVADPAVSAATLVFPSLTSLEETARVMLGLQAHEFWSVSTSRLQPPPDRDLIAIHISRAIPFGDTTCPSEVLVLGDFREFPNTRRSPVTALEMYVGTPMANDPKTGAPTLKANLAHIDTPSPSPTFRQKMWDLSVKGRADSLGEDDNRAKAKVALVVTSPMARRLGCLP
ncbi:MAG: hypothetical protein EPO41_22535 [Reyranella sp.]|uniref:hypothetical protein n=1 Tax=Reyranella sp. TaxID=1929291 RepID=UPI0011FAC2C2|nr:hypothetical protein [Reyranella sp.]TAJ87895.1 MAG: hypothetical protein EPO41_22535 [Reyranella sp.]